MVNHIGTSNTTIAVYDQLEHVKMCWFFIDLKCVLIYFTDDSKINQKHGWNDGLNRLNHKNNYNKFKFYEISKRSL